MDIAVPVGDIPHDLWGTDKAVGETPAAVVVETLGNLTTILERMVTEAGRPGGVPGVLASEDTLFHAKRIPQIALEDYADRIVRYCPSSYAAFVYTFVYIRRLCTLFGHTLVNAHSVHRILCACHVVAAKFCDDVFETNSFYARVGGVSRNELNALEVQLLALLDFRVHCTPAEFANAETFLRDKEAIRGETREVAYSAVQSWFCPKSSASA
eukprot:CAMPEP_0119146394 /NCGR_PEP_ID=MMETSP1310-20130426/38858_1 /TAXON_ID=464262 /ORGANISM="Genus nov. species nov., Strain RCC2339" /LENGTH=211 /DNA_ID=CAMNT_0007138287 /DNA_START=305 /DNA_END=936 /DNA_ORIENTATION=-